MADKKFFFLSSITPTDTSWLWYPYIPRGKVTLILGDPGEGKSTFALNLAAAVSRGLRFPDLQTESKCGVGVIYQNAEDGYADTIVPRLMRAEANLGNILAIDEMQESAEIRSFMLHEMIATYHPSLVVLDPLQAYLGEGVDMHRANEIRPIMSYLAHIAEQSGAAIVLIGHLNKKGDMKSVYRALGSIDLTAAARSVLFIGRDAKEPDHRVIMQVKNSLAPEGAPVSFRVDESGKFIYEGEYEISIEQLMGGGERRITQRDRASELLRGWLTQFGAMKAVDLFHMADSEGIQKRTLQRARYTLGVQVFRNGDFWYWKLPDNCKGDTLGDSL